MDSSSEPNRQHLERVRGALEKVRKVLGDLDQHRHNPATALERTGGAAHAKMPSGASRDDLLRAHEAARLLNLPLKELYLAVHEHRLPAKRVGRFLWFRREDVDAFAKQSPRPGAGGESRSGPRRARQTGERPATKR